MRILVTGASGFVGRQLAPALAAVGHDVFALVRDTATAPVEATAIEADLERPLDLDVLPRVDAVVHLAQANVPFPDGARALHRVNTIATHELLELARLSAARVFVYASSGSVYGFGTGAVREDDVRCASDFYAVTKRSAELLLEAYAPLVATVALRLFAPYGPTQTGRLIPNLIERVREGVPVALNDGGRPRMTPIFVDDVVRAFTRALELDRHQVVNVAGDEVVGIDELAAVIGEAVGRAPVFETGGSAPGDLIGDNRLMHELLVPGRLVPLADGIRATALAGAAA
ncbi:MAG: NAD(P)-dependent oxidoreductase [Actinomycetota bacterium]